MKISLSPEMDQCLSNRCSLVTVTNGTRKVISADQKTKAVTFFNGDIKHITEDGKVVSAVFSVLLMLMSLSVSWISKMMCMCVTGVLLRRFPDNTHRLPDWSAGPSLPQQADW